MNMQNSGYFTLLLHLQIKILSQNIRYVMTSKQFKFECHTYIIINQQYFFFQKQNIHDHHQLPHPKIEPAT